MSSVGNSNVGFSSSVAGASSVTAQPIGSEGPVAGQAPEVKEESPFRRRVPGPKPRNIAPPDECFSRDELLDMVHERRGLTKEIKRQVDAGDGPKRPTRITLNEIKVMKATVRKQDWLIVRVLKGFIGMFTGFLYMIPMAQTPESQRCKLNGHRFGRSWDGKYPSCDRCGKTIKSVQDSRPVE